MDEHKLESLSKGLRRCLQITFAIGLVVTAFLWWILQEWFGGFFGQDTRYYYACVVVLSACGICSLFILWQLIGLLASIGERNPFIEANVRGLHRIAVSAFTISVLFAILLFFRATVLIFGIAYAFLLAGFSFVVLAGLFQRAVVYKNENDLTV